MPTAQLEAGRGDQAVCLRVRDRATGRVVIAKCVQSGSRYDFGFVGINRWALREAAILWNVDHPCIVKLQGATVDACEMYLCAPTKKMVCKGEGKRAH